MIGRLLAYDNGPTGETSNLTNPAQWLLDMGGGAGTTSGETVNAERAMALSVFYACIRNLPEDLARLPFPAYRRIEGRGKQAVPNHGVHRLLNLRPNNRMVAFTFRETLTHWAMGWGNGYAEIVRDPRGTPIAMWPWHPSRVNVNLLDNGEIVYDVWSNKGTPLRYSQSDVFHLHGLGDSIIGYSVARYGAESLGRALAVQRMGAAFFGNGAVMSGALVHPGKLTPEAKTALRAEFASVHEGAKRAYKPLLFQDGLKYERMGVAPEEGQMLETMMFTVVDVCRWFRMPPHKVQALERAHFNNVDNLSIEYDSDALMPWAKRWEQEVQWKLFSEEAEADLFAEHSMLGVLRADHVTRADYYTKLFSIGAITDNEIRSKENIQPVDGGDVRYVPLNMAPVDDQGRQVVPQKPEGPAPEPKGGSDGERRARAIKRAHARTIADAMTRLCRKEQNEIERASEKDASTAQKRLAKFYDGFAACMADALEEPFLAVVEAFQYEAGHEAMSETVAAEARAWLVEFCDTRRRPPGTHEPGAVAVALTERAQEFTDECDERACLAIAGA